MISLVRTADRLYDITLVLNGKRFTIAALRQRAVKIARKWESDANIRILEIASIDGRERYVGPEGAWLFVANNDEANRPRQHP
jgi:hypothetical protein